jgi:hypothetical protein
MANYKRRSGKKSLVKLYIQDSYYRKNFIYSQSFSSVLEAYRYAIKSRKYYMYEYGGSFRFQIHVKIGYTYVPLPASKVKSLVKKYLK